MGKLRNESGFTVVEGLLIVLVLAVVGFGGYYVWHTQQSKTTTTTASAKSTTPEKTKSTQPADPTANWTAFSTKAGGFSLKYPQNWSSLSTAHPECNVGSDDILLSLQIGPSKDTAGNCAAGGQSEVMVRHASNNTCISTGGWSSSITQTSSKSVEISGVQATKYIGTTNAEHDMSGDSIGPVGTKLIEYCLLNGINALYAQHPGWPDVSSDFDLIVTSTLKFN